MPSQPPLANIITLGVHDLAQERGFYQQVGWPIVFDSADFIVFELRGALLALFPLDQLARDAHTQAAPSSPGIRTSVIICVEQAAQVDELAAHARAAGATHQTTHRRGVLRRPRRLLRRPGRQLLGDRLVSGQQPRCGSRPPSRRPTRLSRDTPRLRAYQAASHRSTATRAHSLFGDLRTEGYQLD